MGQKFLKGLERKWEGRRQKVNRFLKDNTSCFFLFKNIYVTSTQPNKSFAHNLGKTQIGPGMPSEPEIYYQ